VVFKALVFIPNKLEVAAREGRKPTDNHTTVNFAVSVSHHHSLEFNLQICWLFATEQHVPTFLLLELVAARSHPFVPAVVFV